MTEEESLGLSPEPAFEESVHPAAVAAELRSAILDLQERGLTHSSAWAAEQLLGIKPEHRTQSATPPVTSAAAPNPDELLFAKALFDAKEYRRAAQKLEGVIGCKALFLRCYALFLAAERRKEEQRVERSGPLGKAEVVNRELDGLASELEAAIQAKQTDGFCQYLYGVVLAERGQKDTAVSALVQSLHECPCNWEAWQAVQHLQADKDSLAHLSLPRHWMRNFFLAAHCLELQHNQEALSRLQDLAALFPHSDWVMSQAATAQYNLRNFDMAQTLFEELRANDPHRIHGMDTYSNILYVKEDFAQLSNVAHSAVETDKYRPESACIVGNYYSLKGQHEKAVMYFRRALKLNPNFLSAWTLMGHEYMEMKNPPAAIEAYRRAVDINSRDFRAWYGLGQTYELLHMPYYALYYFRRAAQLRPEDARMWCAMGHCYEHEQLNLLQPAIRCYRRALSHGDRESVALPKLAQLHVRLGEHSEAAHYYKLHLDALEHMRVHGADNAEALTFLSQYSLESGNLAEAGDYARRLATFGPAASERAKAIQMQVGALQQRAAAASTAEVTRSAAAAEAAAVGGLGAAHMHSHMHTPAAYPQQYASTPAGTAGRSQDDMDDIDTGSDIETDWSGDD